MPTYENSDLRPPQRPSHWSKPHTNPHAQYGHSQEPSHWSKFPPKPHVAEDTLKTGHVDVERKTFVFHLKENSRGRLLRITEEGNGKRASVIIPATGLREPQHLRHRILRWNREQPRHMIDHQMPFDYFALLLPRQFPKYWPQLPPDLTIQGFLPAFRNKHHLIFAFPGRGLPSTETGPCNFGIITRFGSGQAPELSDFLQAEKSRAIVGNATRNIMRR